MNLKNKTALVTGANRGIGFAIVNALLERGVKKVYAASRDVSKLPDFSDERVVPLELDINDRVQIGHAAEVPSDVDLLIHNAGVAAFTSLHTGTAGMPARDMPTH